VEKKKFTGNFLGKARGSLGQCPKKKRVFLEKTIIGAVKATHRRVMGKKETSHVFPNLGNKVLGNTT